MHAKGLALTATVAVLAALLIGCPGPSSTEIAEKALDPGSGLEKAEVHRELQKALEKADEEIGSDPEAVEPYVTKASLLRINGDYVKAVETLQNALDRAKPASDAEKEALKMHMLAFYYRAGTSDMLVKGVRWVEDQIKTEGRKNEYCYAMGMFHRKLYQLQGDGVFKTEANRWFLECRLDEEVISELQKEGLCDTLLE